MRKSILLLLGALVSSGIVSGADIRVEKSDALKEVGDYLPVDPGKPWDFTASIAGKSGTLELYLFQYDARKQRVGAYNVNAVPATETALGAPVKRGDTSFTVADASKWDLKQGNIVVFDAKKDFSDLPNFQHEYYVKKITPQGNAFLVEMSQGLFRDHAQGSLVRLHQDGGHLGWSVNLPVTGEFQRLIEPAPQYGAQPGQWWKGTAFVKLAVRTDSAEPVVIRKWSLKKVSPEELAKRKAAEAAALLAEKQKITPFGFGKILASGNGVEEFTNCYFLYKDVRHYYSGIYQANLAIPAAEAGQFECDFKSTTPGSLEFVVREDVNGKEVSILLSSQTMIPDGQYRRFIFMPAKSALWNPKGIVTGWELRFREYKELDQVIGYRNPEFKREANLIAGADKLLSGQAAAIPKLRPLGQYALTWRDGSCPGVTLNFYDHLMKEIPDSRVRLEPGREKCEFTAPELLIQAKVTVDGNGGWPQLTALSERTRYTPELFWRGQWIWSRLTEGPNYSQVWFARDFDLDEVPEYAQMAIMADDVSDTYVNGVKTGPQTWPYRKAFRFDIAKQLKKGRNQIAVRVYNLDQAAGLCADIYIKTAKDALWISTDSSWLCKETGDDKNLPEKFEAHAVELGPPATTAPWMADVAFAYVGPRGTFTLLKAENGEFTAKLENPVISSFRTLRFERRGASGKSSLFTLPAAMVKNADGTVTVKYPKLLPVAESCKVYLDDDFWAVAGNRPIAELAARTLTHPGLQRAEFVEVGKRTKLQFNGKQYDPTFYHTSEWERMAPALAAGFNGFLVNAPFEEFWLGEGKYDFTELDRNVEALLTVAPNAIFMLDIRFYMPNWWLEAHPDDTSAYFEKTRRNAYDDVQALGSKNWLTAAEAPLKALIDHVKNSPYADRIWGANIGDSRGNEWFWGGATAGQDFHGKPAQPGYSPSDLVAFRALLRRKYGTDEALAKAWNMPGLTIDKAEMPDHKIRRNGAVGSLFNPEANMQIMDWCLFRNQALAEAINHFGSRIKALTDRKWLVGAYYGYMVELSDNPGRSQLITGHNGFLECAKSPDVDFFRAPSRYTYRKPGMPNCVMQTFSTFSLRGKTVFIENDERTAYGPDEGPGMNAYAGGAATALESVGQINREFGMMAASGIAHYWMDHIKGSLYEPALQAVFAEQLKAYQALPEVQNFTPAEVAVAHDVDSIYYSIDGNDGIFPPAVAGVYRRLNYLGVPFRSLVIADLVEKDLAPPNKFYIMLPALVLSRERREQLMARFDREKATVLWLYSAGSCYPDRGPKAEYCGDFLGLKCAMNSDKIEETLVTPAGKYASSFIGAPHFYVESGYDEVLGRNEAGKPVVVMKKSPGGATHIFSTLPDLPKEFLAGLVARAGVFRYTESVADPLWIGNDLVFLHAATGGEKRIRLPEGLKMRAIIGPLSGEFASDQPWHAEAGLTYGFQVFKP